MNWINSNIRVDERVTDGRSCRIRRLLFEDGLVLLALSEKRLQHALDQFIVACNQAIGVARWPRGPFSPKRVSISSHFAL